jgi:hypothetical protein
MTPELDIKWMCFNIFISIDRKVFNLDFVPLKERLVNGSYGYTVESKFRTKKWINEHCVNVLGYIFND